MADARMYEQKERAGRVSARHAGRRRGATIEQPMAQGLACPVSPTSGKEIGLSAGTVRYREAGEGQPVVFVHGYLVDGRLWHGVVDRLSDRCRCIAPDWPMGSHRCR